MEFQGPVAADLADVFSLNLAFLDYVTRERPRRPQLDVIPRDAADRLCGLQAEDRERLSQTPFLLFSLQEHRDARWRRLFAGKYEVDLVEGIDKPSSTEVRIVSAALGLLWQFSKRSPYAARVVSGTTLEWCKNLSAMRLADLFLFATNERGLLQFRYPHRAGFWRKLLRAATHEVPAVRDAARLTALQTLLTQGGHERYAQVAAAACTLPMPSLQVTEHVSKLKRNAYNTPPDESAADQKPGEDL